MRAPSLPETESMIAGTEHAPREALGVLVLTAGARDSKVAGDLVTAQGHECVVCDSFADLMERIASGSGPAVIAEESFSDEGVSLLLDHLDRQPNWSNLPLILFVKDASNAGLLEPLTRRPGISVLDRPIDGSAFVAIVNAAVESRRRQYEVRDLLSGLQALNERLERRASQLQRLALEVTEAEDRERRRLSELLHDDVQQLIVGAKLHLGLLTMHVGDREKLKSTVRVLEELLDQMMARTRSLAHELGATAQAFGGLVPALHWLGRRMKEMHGLTVMVDADAENEPGDDRVKLLLFRSVQELLLNVVKHADSGAAAVALKRRDGCLEAVVSDGGSGFDAEQALQSSSTLAGFGLFAIRERFDLLGGEMKIESRPGRGTRVFLRLPTENAALAPVRTTIEREASEPDTSQLRILIADDHEVLLESLASMLRGQGGMEVVGQASDGAEAVDLTEQLLPDVIVMDVGMPRMNGVEATRLIKSVHPQIRVIGLSMFDEKIVAAKMRQAGASAFVLKTARSEELIRAIRGVPSPRTKEVAANGTGPQPKSSPPHR